MAMRGGTIRRGPEKQKKDWRDHPLAIAGLVAAASISLTASVFIPLVTGHLNDQVETLRSRVSDQADKILTHENKIGYLEAEVRRRDAQVVEARKAAQTLTSQLAEARLALPFNVGSPYPRGLEAFRLGMPAKALGEAIGNRKFSMIENDIWSGVEIDNPLFSSMAIYVNEDSAERPVQQLYYHLHYSGRKKIADEGVRDFLLTALGKPLIISPQKQAFLWRVSDGSIASFEMGDGLIVARKGLVPRWVTELAEEELRRVDRSK